MNPGIPGGVAGGSIAGLETMITSSIYLRYDTHLFMDITLVEVLISVVFPTNHSLCVIFKSDSKGTVSISGAVTAGAARACRPWIKLFQGQRFGLWKSVQTLH